MAMARFRITTSLGEPLSVEVNGQAVSDAAEVAGITAWVDQARIPHVRLDLVGDGVIEGEGIVELNRPADVGPLRDLIQNLDPSALESLALAHMSRMGMDQSPAIAWRAAILELLG